ncbi:MAG: hypothetical protein H8D56_00060 [Planctomycetes bacterium]|nr:hypothetical protein [Planctomycetota bacterium]
MGSITIDEEKLKVLLKQALVEALEERAELIRDLLSEAVEDIALAKAIKEGEGSTIVSKDEVLEALE